MTQQDADTGFMAQALAQAQLARSAREVPVGAVVVRDGQVIGRGHNLCVGTNDPTAHAEIVALRHAAASLGNYRLDGCTLYVTLEPCAMCAGAMLHARLARVVFGATDPKTGAAGSVLNLFTEPRLNHRTAVTDGVGAEGSAALLQAFFSQRREEKPVNPWPLRDDALRTPESCFADLPDYPWQARYVNDLPALDGLRMHYLDEGPRDARRTWLCLHGNPAWSYLFRKMIPVFLAAGDRVVAPDLQDWGGLLGLTLPMLAPQRYEALLVMNTMLATGDVPLSQGFLGWRAMCAKAPDFDVARLFARGNPQMSPAECAAYMAPYPDSGYRAALRAFAPMVPEFVDSDGAAISRAARDFWRTQWSGKTFMAIGVQDPVLGPPVMEALARDIRGCPVPMLLPQAGHFVQEHGAPVAAAAVAAFAAG